MISVVVGLGALAAAAIAVAGDTTAPRPASSATRTITLVNNTDRTIWPAASPGSTSGQTGWTLKPGAELSFQVPHDWNARLWGRTGCHFGGGSGACRTGDCDGRYQCGGWGTIPATLGEFNFDAYKGLDFYDISMVDGSNLPMYATPSGGEADRKVNLDGCLTATKCTTEVHCPAALRVPRHASPEVGCISPCARFGTDRYCCRGPFAGGCSPAKTWPVDYAKVFKRAEPYAYSWSGDDPTSVFTCKGSCDYTITFGVTPPKRGAAARRTSPPAIARAAKSPFPERHNTPFPALTEATFKAPAGNGYELTGSGRRVNYSEAELERFTEPSEGPLSYSTVFLELKRAGASALYFPKGTLSGGKLEARLGKLGVVSLRFVPRRVTFRPPYKDCTGPRTRIEHGVFVGTLRFDGEGGYAHLLRRAIPGTLLRQRPWKCDLTPVSGAPKGTRVGGSAFTHRALSSVSFRAERTSPAGAGTFTAFAAEQRGDVSIERVVEAKGPTGTVEIEHDLSAATVEPPAPFSGSASFAADPGKQTGSWLGDLSVSFPGRPDVRLAGRRYEGSVLKPGQCSTKGNVICVALPRSGVSRGGG
ncbi:MAG: hypothetical protein QOH18_192 [Solirubrobacterales bacterium]|nr:hypothetical protein [Solirubrobacterales bacterium]